MVLAALAAIALASATPTVRDAPWGLTGISEDGRTLHLIYEGGGCLSNDGRAELDTSDPKTVRITVKQTAITGEDAICPAYLAYLPLDVDLGAPLAGRFVTGGPAFGPFSRPETMPNVVGLRARDATAVMKRQYLKSTVLGRKGGVVNGQSPEAGRKPPKYGVGLFSGPFDARARLAITVPAGQTVESVLRHGLRVRYRVDPAVEKAIDALVDCNGEDGGEQGRPTRRATGRVNLHIANGNLRARMRRREQSTCDLTVLSYPAKFRGINDAFLRRTATVTLQHR